MSENNSYVAGESFVSVTKKQRNVLTEKEFGDIAQILTVDLFLLGVDFKHGKVAVSIDLIAYPQEKRTYQMEIVSHERKVFGCTHDSIT